MATATLTKPQTNSTAYTLSLTLGANEYPKSIQLASNVTFANSNTSSRTIYMYICNSSKSIDCQVFSGSASARGSTIMTSAQVYSITNGASLKGQTLYFHMGISGGSWSGVSVSGTFPQTITVNTITGVVVGDPIRKTDLTQTGASPDDATFIKYRTEFAQATKAEASTFNSQVLGI